MLHLPMYRLMLHSAHSLSNILRMPACLSISWRNIVRWLPFFS